MRQALLERQTLKEKKKVIKINNGLIQYFVKVKINAENHDAQNKKIVYKESIILLFFFSYFQASVWHGIITRHSVGRKQRQLSVL